MNRELVDSGIKWLGKIPYNWRIAKVKNVFYHHKNIVKENAVNYNRVALTLNGVILRDKEDANGLQPEDFNNYQIVNKDDIIFKLIDLENVNTSRVGRSIYEGITSPAYILLHEKNEKTKYYDYYFTNLYYQEVFNNLGGNGVRSAINKDDLLNIPLLIPPKTEADRISDYLDIKCNKIDKIIDDNLKEIELLEELKESKIYELLKNYPKVKLKYVISGIKDGTHGSFQRVDEGEYLLSSKNLTESGIVIGENESKISIADYKSIISNGYPRKGDILFCSVGTVGKTCIYELDKSLAFQRSVSFLRVNNRINNKLLLYNTKTRYFKAEVEKSINKALQDGIYMNQIKNLEIFLPPISKQNELSNIIEKYTNQIDNIIEYRKKIIDKLDEYKKSLIFEVITGKKEV